MHSLMLIYLYWFTLQIGMKNKLSYNEIINVCVCTICALSLTACSLEFLLNSCLFTPTAFNGETQGPWHNCRNQRFTASFYMWDSKSQKRRKKQVFFKYYRICIRRWGLFTRKLRIIDYDSKRAIPRGVTTLILFYKKRNLILIN